MTVYIALLRGINVGGKNIIKMADLKKAFEAIELCDVQTYIQSGNVLFKSNEGEEALKIEQAIETYFGFPVAVVLRTLGELEWIISNCPFSEKELKIAEAESNAESLYVAMMTDTPLKENVDNLNVYRSKNEEFRISGREVFLLFSNSIRNSKLAINLHKLGVPSTVRNWKTVNKLVYLGKAM